MIYMIKVGELLVFSGFIVIQVGNYCGVICYLQDLSVYKDCICVRK